MSARGNAAKQLRRSDPEPEPTPATDDESLEAILRIEQAAHEIHTLNAILQQVDKSVTAAAKRAVKRAGSWPLRLNSREAKRRAS